MTYPEIEQFKANPSAENRSKLYDAVANERFKVSEFGISSRVFTHWRQNGLIPEFEDRKWIRLNLAEAFWILMIKDLREIGLPLERIAGVKDQLFSTYKLRDALVTEEGLVNPDLEEQLIDEGMPKVVAKGLVEAISVAAQNSGKAVTDAVYGAIFDVIYNVPFKDQSGTISGSKYGTRTLEKRDRVDLSPILELEIPFFFTMVLNSLFLNFNEKVTIDINGEVGLLTDQFPKAMDEVLKIFEAPLVVLPLKRYVHQLMTEAQFTSKVESLGLLNEVEQEVIKTMREGKVQELKIIFDKNDEHTDLVYQWQGSVNQEDLYSVTDRFIDKKHVGLEMKSNDGKTIQYVYQDRKRFKS